MYCALHIRYGDHHRYRGGNLSANAINVSKSWDAWNTNDRNVFSNAFRAPNGVGCWNSAFFRSEAETTEIERRGAVPLVRAWRCSASSRSFRASNRRVSRGACQNYPETLNHVFTLVGYCPSSLSRLRPSRGISGSRFSNKRHVNIVGVSFSEKRPSPRSFSPLSSSLSLYPPVFNPYPGTYLRFSRFRERDRQSKYVNAESCTRALRFSHNQPSGIQKHFKGADSSSPLLATSHSTSLGLIRVLSCISFPKTCVCCDKL